MLSPTRTHATLQPALIKTMDDFDDLEADLLDDLDEEDDSPTETPAVNVPSVPSLFGALPQSGGSSSSATSSSASSSTSSSSSASSTATIATTTEESQHAISDGILAGVAHFTSSSEYTDVLSSVSARKMHSANNQTPSYKEISHGTRLMQTITDKTSDLHRLVVDMYSIKFPDLHHLVTNLEMYFRVVFRIGNDTDVASCGIENLLPKTDAIRVVVSGSTSNDSPLPRDTMQRVESACSAALSLFDARDMISNMVMDGMRAIAPNVTAIVGPQVASELVGLAGGIPELSRVPGGNMMLLGQQKKVDLGGASTTGQLHRGVVYKSPIVLQASDNLQRQVAREVANKVALAARVDASKRALDGAIGTQFLKKIQSKYQKHWDAPDKARTAKALPVPDAGEKKSRRGGRRKRAFKKKYGLTDVHKDANRVSFGGTHDEYGDSAMGRTFGTLGQAGSGRVRQTAKVEQKVTLSKSAQRKLDRANLGKRKTPSSGLASSLVLDSDRGIEFVDPEAAKQRVRDANSKYFGTKSGFRSVVPRLHK